MTDKERILTPGLVLQLLLFILLVPLLPLLIAWRWDWWEGWVFALGMILSFVISRALAAKRNPDIITERGKITKHENIEPWDKTLTTLLGIAGLLLPLTAGLDARFGQPANFLLWAHLVAAALYLAGMVIASWALIANRFFSGVVRIQEDRGQVVVSSGPYRWLRHPGYSGALLSYLATPFLLDSWWACPPALLLTAIMVTRTALEDRTLQEKLPGYKEYTREVRSRMFPGIW
ncbi:MAG: isoprenylcysteine carboxylmethyltransferase family protein [Anaerolineaceae bacterium]|nr:isoprenylcysteine carboxylmethyltransferase family protein [Anaerolineaceae bacterium]